LAERGYNQSELLAAQVAAATGLPMVRSGLERVRATEQQAKMTSGTARQHNMRGAFVWRGPAPPPRRALLIDDVFTTGATLAACADALRAAGAHEIRALALARSRPLGSDT
jgi:predicted amidophosphoribosyltransferase